MKRKTTLLLLTTFLFSMFCNSLQAREKRRRGLLGGLFRPGKNGYKTKEQRDLEEEKRRLEITRKKPSLVTIEEETEIGQSLTAKYLESLEGELISSYYYQKAWDYCNAMTLAIAPKLWSRRERKYHLGIVRSKRPEVFSTPGGFIVVTTAMLEALESEGQLAALIAFEMILISRKVHLHAYHRGARNRSKKNALGNILAASLKNSSTRDSIPMAGFNSGELNVLDGRFGKDNVFEADKCAASVMAYLGYSPVSYEIYLRTLNELRPNMMRTDLPSLDERLTQLNKYVKENLSWALGFAQDRERYKKKLLDNLAILPGCKN